ncbi:MAG: tRNA pseudouridine(55) synthase TruB [Synechocystis sp.]|nr:tRNA pseudouridine(55) synthase TruB [Synechocystis sp.]
MFGFLNLNKPLQWTSHDCVGKVRRLFKLRKVGHGGTLDPLATGVLPIAVGQATRLLPYLPSAKRYQAVVRFGLQTDSDDLAGKVIADQSADHLTLEMIKAELPQFLGKIRQIPPQYSAIQVDGKRLYQLARAGIACDVPSREVEIFKLHILHWRSGDKPELTLTVDCGEGTYIRALARDLGDRLGVGATLAGLDRQLSGGMEIGQSITVDELQTVMDRQNPPPLLPPNQVLAHLPPVILAPDLTKRWYRGQRLLMPDLPLGIVRVEDSQQTCLGIAMVTAEDQGTVLRPKVVLGEN